jgi:monofunctional biosynthetic peptidoglycan transglycosylase
VLRFVPPVTSAFMLERRLAAATHGEGNFVLKYQWIPFNKVSSDLPIALVAAEDQKFPTHHGFDLQAIADALDEAEEGERLRGASTISQQTAKNLFLWNGRSFVRKGLEAYFTVLLEVTWPKRRILEVYLNIAEFGDGIYGAEAAARQFFGKSAAQLGARESALLASVLPNPKKLRADRPSPYVSRHAEWVERQVHQLGGANYLPR